MPGRACFASVHQLLQLQSQRLGFPFRLATPLSVDTSTVLQTHFLHWMPGIGHDWHYLFLCWTPTTLVVFPTPIILSHLVSLVLGLVVGRPSLSLFLCLSGIYRMKDIWSSSAT